MNTREEMILSNFMAFILNDKHSPEERRMLLETHEALFELITGEYQND